MRWGDQYLAGEDGPPLVLEHHCGHELTAQVVCQACGEPLRAGHTRPLIDNRLRRPQRRAERAMRGSAAARHRPGNQQPGHWLSAGCAIDLLAEDVGMTGVARSLTSHMRQEPPKRQPLTVDEFGQ
jgi:hypothetical protein